MISSLTRAKALALLYLKASGLLRISLTSTSRDSRRFIALRRLVMLMMIQISSSTRMARPIYIIMVMDRWEDIKSHADLK